MTDTNLDLRAGLVASQRAAESKEAELYPRVTETAGDDQWRIQDHLAHLAAWREHATETLQGHSTPVDDIDAYNARLYDQTRDLSPEEVLQRARTSWVRLIEMLETLTSEQLHAPLPGRADRELWTVVPGDGHLHLAEHLSFIAEAAGDAAGADAAQLWARDIVQASFDDPTSVSHADYNLACYYAKAARTAEAIPPLRRALELNPELIDLARRDSDLDPIRSNPEVVELVGG